MYENAWPDQHTNQGWLQRSPSCHAVLRLGSLSGLRARMPLGRKQHNPVNPVGCVGIAVSQAYWRKWQMPAKLEPNGRGGGVLETLITPGPAAKYTC